MVAGPASLHGNISLQLRSLSLQLQLAPGPLLAPIQAALAHHGHPLRWAVTACHTSATGERQLCIEAVVITDTNSP